MAMTSESQPQVCPERQVLHETAVHRVIEAMRQNLCNPLTLKEMADIACFSQFHFNRLFKELTGIPPSQFLYALRLDEAKRLLLSTDLRVTDVCFEVGYNSLGSFINRFTELVGLSPHLFKILSRDLEGLQLEMLRVDFEEMESQFSDASCRKGNITLSDEFDGAIFTGIFRRAIPEGVPVACTLTLSPGEFALPEVPRGRYFVCSVAIPWNAGPEELLTLDRTLRGRSKAICFGPNEAPETINLSLEPRDYLHPPIIVALPILIVRRLASRLGVVSPGRDSAKRVIGVLADA